nr:NHL repeat-containing protein [Evansella caseinilytica]
MWIAINTGPAKVLASNDPDAYNYSFWEEAVPAPAAYKAVDLVDGESLGIGAFKEPNDFYVSNDHLIYVMDSGNNRVVILDERFHLIRTIDSFIQDGTEDGFSNPQGIFVNDENHVFIADTGNQRVIHLDQDFQLVKIIAEPESELLSANFTFLPVKVVVDNADRVFVMVEGVFDGFMEFSVDGHFTTFIGANRVRVDPIEYLWKRFATREQRSQMVMYVPTEFTGLDIDEKGFLYATNADNSDDVIKKLNARGDDILRREGYFAPRGDVRYTQSGGPSRLIDISVSDDEIYSVLDSKRGRIFTYNGDGHLLYVFGGIGNKLGEFHSPVAIERYDDHFLVLDKELGEITVFIATAYGQMINEAVKSYERGDEEAAAQLFEEVVNLNVNLEFAYTGIGKALLRQGQYEAAMDHFRISLDQNNYSKAYLLYRNQTLRKHFASIMTGIIGIGVLILAAAVYRKLAKRKRGIVIE